MKFIEHLFNDIYLPEKAFIVYRHDMDGKVYVEAHDIDGSGKPVNAHPLSLAECAALAAALQPPQVFRHGNLTSRGLMPSQVLYLNAISGFAMWHTPPQKANLLFKDSLSIPCGIASIPGLVWMANREDLYLFAVKGKTKPQLSTALYHAPFFNMHDDGEVCMGTIDINIDPVGSLEDFIGRWQQYFFNSYFSHVIGGCLTTKTNIVQLWQGLVNTGKAFPEEVFLKHSITLKQLIR